MTDEQLNGRNDEGLSPSDEQAIRATNAAPDRDYGHNGNGSSIEDLAEAGEDDGAEQITLFGTSEKLSLSVGGRHKPTESAVKFKAKQELIAGQFSPDEVVTVQLDVRVDKVEIVYVRDSAGGVKAVKRVHHLTPVTGAVRVDSEAAVIAARG